MDVIIFNLRALGYEDLENLAHLQKNKPKIGRPLGSKNRLKTKKGRNQRATKNKNTLDLTETFAQEAYKDAPSAKKWWVPLEVE